MIGLVIYCWKARPWLAVGWVWFLITLFPVLGFIQVGAQAMADRYTYIPSIGICVAAVWEITAWAGRRPRLARSITGLGLFIMASLIVATHFQLRYWADSESLFRHALRCTTDNPLAHYNLGCALTEKGQFDAAILEFESVLRLDRNIPDAHVNLGVALQTKGNTGAATAQFAEAVRLKPGNVAARNNLGLALGALDRATILAKSNSQPALLVELEAHAQRYRSRLPWRECRVGERVFSATVFGLAAASATNILKRYTLKSW